MSEKPQNHEPGNDANRAARPPRAAPQPPKKERPLAPKLTSDPLDASTGPTGMQIVEDDDAVMIPELAPERLATASRYDPSKPKPRDPSRGLFFRRTMIPILLTCGVILPALSALWFATEDDHVVRGTGVWLPVTFIVLGAIFLLLAVVNMAQVRHLLSVDARSRLPR